MANRATTTRIPIWVRAPAVVAGILPLHAAHIYEFFPDDRTTAIAVLEHNAGG